MSVVVREDQMNEHVDEKEKPQLKPHSCLFRTFTFKLEFLFFGL